MCNFVVVATLFSSFFFLLKKANQLLCALAIKVFLCSEFLFLFFLGLFFFFVTAISWSNRLLLGIRGV